MKRFLSSLDDFIFIEIMSQGLCKNSFIYLFLRTPHNDTYSCLYFYFYKQINFGYE